MLVLDALLLAVVQALANAPLYIGERVLNGFADLFGGIILFIIGILVIVLVVAAAIVLLPAIAVGVVVWLLTGSFFYAGISFLIVALLSLIAIADD
jgi:hypothetical protein